MSCEVCERPMIWAGQSYVPHTEAQHAGTRKFLLRAVATRLAYLTDVRLNQVEAHTDDCVAVQWRSGVYRRQLPDEWWMVPCEWWDSLSGEAMAGVLRAMRAHLSAKLLRTHGVEVNPATWFHRVHDYRLAHSEACVCEACTTVREARSI